MNNNDRSKQEITNLETQQPRAKGPVKEDFYMLSIVSGGYRLRHGYNERHGIVKPNVLPLWYSL